MPLLVKIMKFGGVPTEYITYSSFDNEDVFPNSSFMIK